MAAHYKYRYAIKARPVTVEEIQGFPYEVQPFLRFMGHELEAVPVFAVRHNILHVVRQGNGYFM
jgi:hypothetical protein